MPSFRISRCLPGRLPRSLPPCGAQGPLAQAQGSSGAGVKPLGGADTDPRPSGRAITGGMRPPPLSPAPGGPAGPSPRGSHRLPRAAGPDPPAPLRCCRRGPSRPRRCSGPPSVPQSLPRLRRKGGRHLRGGPGPGRKRGRAGLGGAAAAGLRVGAVRGGAAVARSWCWYEHSYGPSPQLFVMV